MLIFDIVQVEKRIGYVFKDKMLLRQCFTHSSYANENCEKDNERLEFFGDAIIEFVVTEHLYKNMSGDEGKLTENRAKMVSKAPLLKAVEKMGLGDYVLIGNGLNKNSKKDEKLYSSIYEAVVAGIYLDGGLAPAKKFIKDTIILDFEKAIKTKIKKSPIANNSKSALQEYVQKSGMGSISYELLWKKGPDHMPTFRCAVLLNGATLAEGEGNSKKIAEAQAAERALEKLKFRRS